MRALKAGFRDELTKIGGVNMSGISADTILNYPAPEPMPSAAYEKAKAILQKAEQFQQLSQEKEAAARARSPDVLPAMEQLLIKHKGKDDEPPPGKLEKAKSIAGHGLAGAGSAKFIQDWVEHGRMSRPEKYVKRKMHRPGFFGRIRPKVDVDVPIPHKPMSSRTKFLAISGGAALGIGEYARKQLKKKRWEKKGKTKTSATPFSFPSTGRATQSFLGKSGPSIKTQAPSIGRRGLLPKV